MRRRQLPGEPPPPSKTALKRQAQSVQELADRLIAAPDSLVSSLALPEKLAEAIAQAREISRHGAKLRQRLYVAKLMRGVDPAPIRAALEAQAELARQEAARSRRAERWRDRLIAEGEAAIAEFLGECPAAAVDELRTLAAAARAERASGRQGGAGRLLRWLRDRLDPGRCLRPATNRR